MVQDITGSEQINTLGFCVGGTILATALAVLAARGEKPAASVTLLTTLLDFTDTGVLDLFIDEAMVQMREMTHRPRQPERRQPAQGPGTGHDLQLPAPNDLVWNYVVGNYLKGETPPPFDLLYWNSDSTNLPGPMYCWYLRNTYLENNLVKPGKLTVCGEKVDLGAINVPAYIYASREDHIVPWDGAYAQHPGAAQGQEALCAGRLGPHRRRDQPAGQGQAQPLDRHRRNACRPKAQDWFDKAKEHPGSWWTDWAAWLKGHAGKQIAAPKGYGQPQLQGHRAGAGPLRQAEGLNRIA